MKRYKLSRFSTESRVCYLVIFLEVRVISQDRFPAGFFRGGVIGSINGRIGFGSFPDILSAFFEMFSLRTTSVSSSSHLRSFRRKSKSLDFRRRIRKISAKIEGKQVLRKSLFLSSSFSSEVSFRALLMGLRVLVFRI